MELEPPVRPEDPAVRRANLKRVAVATAHMRVAQARFRREQVVEARPVSHDEVGLLVVKRGKCERRGRQEIRDPDTRLVFGKPLLP